MVGKVKITRLKWVIVFLGGMILLASAVLISRYAALAAPSQPIAFSHETHTEAGVQCLYCHPGPMRSDIAGLPTENKCAGCHKIIATDRPEIQEVIGFWERGEAIPWKPVAQLPDHTFFSHQPHFLAGISCEACHGDVGRMSVARPVVIMDMGWCLDCHLAQPEEKIARLADCLTCHK